MCMSLTHRILVLPFFRSCTDRNLAVPGSCLPIAPRKSGNKNVDIGAPAAVAHCAASAERVLLADRIHTFECDNDTAAACTNHQTSAAMPNKQPKTQKKAAQPGWHDKCREENQLGFALHIKTKKEKSYVKAKKGYAEAERREKAASKKHAAASAIKVVSNVNSNIAALMRKPTEVRGPVATSSPIDLTDCTHQVVAEETEPWVCLCCTFPNPESSGICSECDTAR